MKSCKFCPVGKLIPGIHVVVMDDQLNVKPVGVHGEVWRGRGLTFIIKCW